MRRSLPAALTLAVLASTMALTSCAAGGPAPAASTTATTTAAVATPTPSAATNGPATIAAPSVCDAVDLKADAAVAGADLAACVVGFSKAAGSGHETFSASDGTTGTADFVFGDAPALSGTVTSSGGTTSFVLTPDASWVTIDGAWVQGDATSSDPKKMLAGTIGQAYRAFADPSATASLISSAPTWTVQKDQDVVDLPDGTQARAWRVQADAPFSAVGADVQEMTLWLTSGHVPAGVQATVSVAGTQTTTTQHFSGWGMPVSIATPQP
ncbi:hypothetical protein E5344_14510 [Microbacterium laevaniformans]|uniref:LppX_LprAFG lipoprotein n=1 Tax=Microbacterium laevaniformans TaxID=36807 RepID=A0A4S2CWB6_9MICO|nr:hypothetical protein [Microbacterium laevaniformans]TGY33259.1 hypothetical protein E5344_14510 [Microbacterium laevaniformans]